MAYKVANHAIHIKQNIGNNECLWHTFYENDEVPLGLVDLFKSQGGQFKEEIIVNEIKAVEEVIKIQEKKLKKLKKK